MGYFEFCATFSPLTDVFIAVQFCFSEREMDVKRGGGGFHINLSIHPFHSPKRLRLQWRDQGYKATRNPPNAAKKKKSSKQPQPSLQAKIWSQTSFLPSDKPLKVLQVSDSSNSVFMVQCGKRPALVFRFALKKLLPHLLYFLSPRSSSLHLNIIFFQMPQLSSFFTAFVGNKVSFRVGSVGTPREKKVL